MWGGGVVRVCARKLRVPQRPHSIHHSRQEIIHSLVTPRIFILYETNLGEK